VDADPIIALLGRPADDPAVTAAFLALKTRRRPALDPEDRDALRDWVLVRRQGVELGFVDAVWFRAGEPQHRRRAGVPILLNQVYFYRDRDDITAFAGRLPFGLAWSDSRDLARQRMQPWEATRRSYRTDCWDAPQCRLVVAYRDQDTALDNVLCLIREHDWPEDGRIQPRIGIADWIASFGLAVSSALLAQRLLPLPLGVRLAAGDDEHEVDFRHACGLELYLADTKDLKHRAAPYGPQGEGPVLAAAQFLRSREFDARQWRGELPCGLTFDDTQETLFNKVGGAPVLHEDEQFSGRVRWQLPGMDLEVLYNNIENHLLRIMIMAPGYGT
jgi:hypothetical protein